MVAPKEEEEERKGRGIDEEIQTAACDDWARLNAKRREADVVKPVRQERWGAEALAEALDEAEQNLPRGGCRKKKRRWLLKRWAFAAVI
jgi:hypothetical protein